MTRGRPKPPSRWPPRQQSAARLEGLLDPNDRAAGPKPGGMQRQRGYVQQGLAERRLLRLLPLREISWHNATVALRVNIFHSGVGRHGHRQRASKRTRKRATRKPPKLASIEVVTAQWLRLACGACAGLRDRPRQRATQLPVERSLSFRGMRTGSRKGDPTSTRRGATKIIHYLLHFKAQGTNVFFLIRQTAKAKEFQPIPSEPRFKSR
jgi:hypothetical protein